MTLRQTVWFLIAYVGIVALAIWFDTAVLCRGAVKWGECSGFRFYFPLWLVFLAPLPITAILLERWRRSQPPPTAHILMYIGGILAVSQVGFLHIERFPLLLVTEGAAIGVAALLRYFVVRGVARSTSR